MRSLNCFKTVIVFLCLAAIYCLPACTKERKADDPLTAEQQRRPRADVGALTAESQKCLAAGEYQKAVDIFRTEYARNHSDQVLLRGYMKTVEEIGNAANAAYAGQDFLKAGRIYRVLLVNYQDLGRAHPRPFGDRQFLQSRVAECSSSLSREGFEQYRNGNMKKAISIWEGLLSFDPDNSEIRKALQTARNQLKNLGETR